MKTTNKIIIIDLEATCWKGQIPLEGTHHRGIYDAKNISIILNWCLKNQ